MLRYTLLLSSLFLLYSPVFSRATLGLATQEYYDEVSSLFSRYTRQVTILEIGQKSLHYILPIAASRNALCIALMAENAHYVASIVQERGYKNVVVLNPPAITYNTIYTLGRCEHFDIVIMHDIKRLLKEDDLDRVIDSLVKLGDYVFIETESKKTADKLSCPQFKEVKHSEESTLFLSYKPKETLDIARYTQWRRKPTSEPKYHIKSDFHKKIFYKEDIKQATAWVPGINLITFVMLRGIYPTDTLIRHQFNSMKSTIPYHNDLVLGNVIVQGQKLVPIDFNDKRRDANMNKCLKSAIKVFNGDKSRFKNPEKRIMAYYDTI